MNAVAASSDRLTNVLSQCWYGERAALMLCGQLIALLDGHWMQPIIVAQAVDEWRHAEVLRIHIGEYGTEAAIDTILAHAVCRLAESPWWMVKVIGLHLIVESCAIAAMQGLTAEADPALQQTLAHILADERRHLEVVAMLGQAWQETEPAIRSAMRGEIEAVCAEVWGWEFAKPILRQQIVPALMEQGIVLEGPWNCAA